MNTQNPAQSADPSPVDQRVQPGCSLSGEVKRGGDHPKAFRRANSFVYFILCAETDRMKIGHAKDVARRFKGLQTGSPGELSVLAVWPALNPAALERAMHDRWAKDRRQGEWFQCAPDMIHVAERYAYTLEGQRLWSITGDGPAPKRPPWLAQA